MLRGRVTKRVQPDIKKTVGSKVQTRAQKAIAAKASPLAARSGVRAVPCSGSTVVVRELSFAERQRAEVGQLVHRLINVTEECFQRFEPDYVSAFEREPQYRVLAAYDERGAIVGGCAFYTVPKGVYIEFIGTLPNSHAGKPLVEWVRENVIADPKKHFVALGCIPALCTDKTTIHTFAWYLNRGFVPMDTSPVLHLLTSLLHPEASKPLAASTLLTRLKVPRPSPGTIAMVWIKCPERAA